MPDIAHQSTAHQTDSTDRKDSQRQQKIKDTLITGLRYQRLYYIIYRYFSTIGDISMLIKPVLHDRIKREMANFTQASQLSPSRNLTQIQLK